MSDYGTVGSDGSTEAGILYDPTGTGNYGVNDILTPNNPFDRLYLTDSNASGTFSVGSNNNGEQTDFGTQAPTSLSPISAARSGTSAAGSLQISNTYALSTIAGRSVMIGITTTLNALTGILNNVQFLPTLGPDSDVNSYGAYAIENVVLSADQSYGTGTANGQTICIYSDTSHAHQPGVSADWSTSPATYRTGVDHGNSDYTIGMGFDLSDIAEGQSDTFTYAYVLCGSLNAAGASPSGTNVPEPATLALLGASIAGVGAARGYR